MQSLSPAARLNLAWRVAERVKRQRGFGTALAAFRMVWGTPGGGFGYGGDYADTFGHGGRYGLFGTLPGSQRDLIREVGDPAHNSAVSIGLNWIASNVAEPRLQVAQKKRDGTEQPVPNHPLTNLLNQPNPHYDGDALWAATSKSYKVCGNAYWLKARGLRGAGYPVELWYVPHWEISPRWPRDGSAFISDYLYRPGGRGTGIPVPRENVVHFRFDLDPYNGGRTSTAPLFPVLRSILSDNEAETFMASLLINMAIPGVVVSPEGLEAGSPGIPEPERQAIEDKWVEKFTGDGRGRPLVTEGPIKVTQLGLTPEQLVLDKVRQIPEDRICAALGVPPMVLGLTSGAAHKTYANYEEARRAAYQDCIIPMQGRFARALQTQLLPELGNPLRETVGWDYAHVKCLQEDQDKLAKRWVLIFGAGICKLGVAQSALGIEVDEARKDEYGGVAALPAPEPDEEGQPALPAEPEK